MKTRKKKKTDIKSQPSRETQSHIQSFIQTCPVPDEFAQVSMQHWHFWGAVKIQVEIKPVEGKLVVECVEGKENHFKDLVIRRGLEIRPCKNTMIRSECSAWCELQSLFRSAGKSDLAPHHLLRARCSCQSRSLHRTHG